ncbi:WxL domain-containing protein [Evansella tamaricis]|uniref:WxL domain-containing protein n=1 Tax=Evansella tamaricis TaxID=2069301 RepID=A0ABS6JFX5_9BACI|nr:WxL domain-containing protein [Evansella tamaricis]MBU9711365.1 WxL domain-containing protein [Evansella tamaricis]
MFALYGKSTKKYLVPFSSTILFIFLSINIPTVKSSETSVNFTVSSGTLHIQSSKENVTLRMNEKTDVVAYGDVGKLTIVDATGSGSGWVLTVKSTPINEVEQNGRSVVDDFEGSLSLQTQAAKIQKGEGSSNPPNWVGSKTYHIEEHLPIKVLSANQGEGMGTYNIDFGVDSLKFQLQQNISDDTYLETSLVWNIVSGP